MSAASLPRSSNAPPPDDTPRVVIDAGGEPWGRILGLLERRRRELPAGSVLEVHSANPLVRLPLHAWCRSAGCALTTEAGTGEQSTYRITLPPPPAAETRRPYLPQNTESS